ncbi:hypothetical protein J1N35_043980 [Gossypium stocksii]|uniref:Uncharacterized protein n=1 Tax=Gossypium stocksii TaxID=47602 RepID=A0A9D3ZFK4_9ROSI|nr:hypothetical protein J1N35_043980 [Gossypium stocksii]
MNKRQEAKNDGLVSGVEKRLKINGIDYSQRCIQLSSQREEEFTLSKGGTSKVSMKMPTKFEHVTTTPKLKRRKVSAVQDFPPRCGRGTTSNFELHRQIAVDQGKYSLSVTKRV